MYRQERVPPNQLPPAFAGKGNPRALWESVSHKSKTYRIMKTRVLSCSYKRDSKKYWVGVVQDVVHEPTGLISSRYAYFNSKKKYVKGDTITFPNGSHIIVKPMIDRKTGKPVKNKHTGEIMMTGEIALVE